MSYNPLSEFTDESLRAELSRRREQREQESEDNCEGQDAMQRTCDDCGAGPGEECSWSCSSNWK